MLFHGFCVGTPPLLNSPEWLDLLRAHQPIGCRDIGTVKLLKAAGIDAYWSGCLTMMFGRNFSRVPDSQRRGVYFVDIHPDVEASYIPDRLRRRAIRASTFPPQVRIDNRVFRWGWLAGFIDMLRTAELVVTRRLHAALPCLGFGTPFVVIPDAAISNARHRFSGFLDFLPGAFRDDDAGCRKIDWDRRAPIAIPEQFEVSLARFTDQLAGRFGIHPPKPVPVDRILVSDRIRFRNPGFGFEPGGVRLAMGSDRTECVVANWTDEVIEILFPDHVLTSRMDISVEIRRRPEAAYEAAGSLRDLQIPASLAQLAEARVASYAMA
jgi:hypothetical protein